MTNEWTKKLEALDAERIELGKALGWLTEAAEPYEDKSEYLCEALKNARKVFLAWPQKEEG